MLLSALNLKKEYGIQTVLDIEKIEIKDGDRIGLTGRNGAGKSTLLGILSGRIPCDKGVIKRNCSLAEILQTGESKGQCEGRYISQMSLKDSALKSGGEKTRKAIAAAFSQHASLLFADEPTTNLDLEGVAQLEKMLAGYRGAILMISHDRKLLDQVCTQIWELDQGKLRIFDGNYTAWLEQRARERDFQNFEYEQYQKEKKRLERIADSLQRQSQKMAKPPKRMGSSEWILYKGTASIQQGHVQSNKRAVLSRMEHLEKKERPPELPQVSMKLTDQKKIRARYAATAKELTIQYGEHLVLDHVSFYAKAGNRTFLTGRNGAGKSTLIRAILEKQPGTFIPSDARVAYFSQDLSDLKPEKTVLENVTENAAFPQHICRAVLANLYMSQDDMLKPVSVLSGGEQVKTALARILVSGCNFMILDEPTNHMDIYTMEGLEQLLSSYDGTLLAISHDRAFMEHIGGQIWLVEKGCVTLVSQTL